MQALAVLRRSAFAALSLCALVAPLHAAERSEPLQRRMAALEPELAHSPLGQPIHIESGQDGDRVRGDVYALVPQPFARFAPAVQRPSQWCDVMILVFNVRRCTADDAHGAMTMNIARRPEQPVQDTQRIVFAQRLLDASPEHLQARLAAAEGPLGTADYRIELEAIPAPGGRTFLHLHYGYTDSFTSKLAMQTYLGTVGRDKIGFSVVGRGEDGRPQYVQGLRGAIERTTMRYYLALASYLDTLGAPPDARLKRWFEATERYPRQLHEMSEQQYLELKRAAMRDPSLRSG
jgi:hypothetical protein